MYVRIKPSVRDLCNFKPYIIFYCSEATIAILHFSLIYICYNLDILRQIHRCIYDKFVPRRNFVPEFAYSTIYRKTMLNISASTTEDDVVFLHTRDISHLRKSGISEDCIIDEDEGLLQLTIFDLKKYEDAFKGCLHTLDCLKVCNYSVYNVEIDLWFSSFLNSVGSYLTSLALDHSIYDFSSLILFANLKQLSLKHYSGELLDKFILNYVSLKSCLSTPLFSELQILSGSSTDSNWLRLRPETTSYLLGNCSKLKILETCISTCLLYLHGDEYRTKKLNTVYSLEKVVLGSFENNSFSACNTLATELSIRIAAVTCPFLTELELTVRDYRGVDAISEILTLRSLSLNWIGSDFGQFESFIAPLRKLTLFKLGLFRFKGVDLSCVAILCPYLESLSVEYCSFVSKPSGVDVHFTSLKELKLVCDQSIPVNVMKLLLLYSHGLLTLRLEGEISLNNLLSVVLVENSLSKLEELYLSFSDLQEQLGGVSVSNVTHLLNSCTSLQHLSTSSYITRFVARCLYPYLCDEWYNCVQCKHRLNVS